VAELTARGARIATGRLSRADVLAQLSPERSDRTSQAERVTLLITTDVLSEGLDLHAASVLVHLDLPWNPARLEQRIGRLRRIGARHDTVFVYALAPPAASERVLRVEQRLRAKLRLAHDVVGVGVQSLPALGFESQRAPPETASELHAMLEGWRLGGAEGHATVQPSGEGPRQFAFAGAIAAPAGFLALLADADARLLVGDIGRGVTSDPRAIVTLVRAITKARDRPIVTPELDAALRTVTRWAEARHGQRLVGVGAVAGARLRARLNQRIAALLATAPRHDRVRIAALASQAQALARRQRLTAGAERALAALVDAPMADEQWLREIIGLRDALPREDERVQMPRILALILVRPEA
jgi:hypothetical protein